MTAEAGVRADLFVDCRGETCPIPLVEFRKAVMRAEPGQVIEIVGTHGLSKEEIPMAVESLGLELLRVEEDRDGAWHILVRR
ncbi:TPA: sulfurtransferase TusA family protein [Candidatus Bipolaricaulota bacterium]|nr:sulfurtransferase TusA family protein [Candidatus Bipolaricaulota bacterium]